MSKVYGKFVKLMREQGAVDNPGTLEIAKVTSVSPLAILLGDLPLTKEELLVNPNMLNKIEYQGNLIREGLKVGDLVLVQPINNQQKWIVVSKVVDA